jgi:hypothetical protein
MEQRRTLARDVGIKSLYHYAAFDMARIFPIVAFNRLYFSKPYGFDDPWDCRPFFDVNCINDSVWREQTALWMERLCEDRLSTFSPWQRERFKRIIREHSEILKNMALEANRMTEKIGDVFRIFCFSACVDHPLIWSHYTNKHTGVCLEFDTTTTFFSDAVRVTYGSDCPSMRLQTDNIDEALLPVFTKSQDWGYEAEFRLIAQERTKKVNHQTLIADDHWVRFPPKSLKSIIVGCMMGERDREAMKTLVRNAPNPVTLLQAIKSPDRYELTIVPLM